MPTTEDTPRPREAVCTAILWDAGSAHANVRRRALGTVIAFNSGLAGLELIDKNRGSLRVLLTDALAQLDALDAVAHDERA